jgi:vitamin B12 transporter
MKIVEKGNGYASYLIFLSLIFVILFFYPSVSAQSAEGSFREEEMQILRMFYKEKDLVVTPTRTPKPISQVAENITVITAKDIENMNAHTVAEVLERVNGIFVDFGGHDFGSTSLLHIQGSEDRHVLVLLDGVPWNFLNGGNAETNSIPVRIIQRIEVIKGPASSAWGSSLGGVINIVTKNIGNADNLAGSISASYGERSTQDYSAEISGKAGAVGYYLFVGRQDSNGLRNDRYFENNSFYSRFNIPISTDVKFDFTMGYSEPYISFGDFPIGDMTSRGIIRVFLQQHLLLPHLIKS